MKLFMYDEPRVVKNVGWYLGDQHQLMGRSGIIHPDTLADILTGYQPEGVISGLTVNRLEDGLQVYRVVQEWQSKTPFVFYTVGDRAPREVIMMIQAGILRENIIGKREVAEDVPKILAALQGQR
tara:strand:- start:396 stop:770 length:375 start_codon:yes stop_codon:yes gene_type:complete